MQGNLGDEKKVHVCHRPAHGHDHGVISITTEETHLCQALHNGSARSKALHSLPISIDDAIIRIMKKSKLRPLTENSPQSSVM
jgi:hypothetical protein